MKIFKLQGLSTKIKITHDNTFAEMIIINSISARPFKIDSDLKIVPDFFIKYEHNDDYTEYTLHADPSYQSAKGDDITIDDFLFSIDYFVSHKDEIDYAVEFPQKIKEIIKIGKNILKITLNSKDRNFINKLTTPWFYILKKDRPLYLILGENNECQLPYPTGKVHVKYCADKNIILEKDGKEVRLIDNRIVHTVNKSDKVYEVVSENKFSNKAQFATLTVMGLYFNPESKLPSSLRKVLSRELRHKAPVLAKATSLVYSETVTPKWLMPDLVLDKEHLDHSRALVEEIKSYDQEIVVLLDSSIPYHDELKKFITQIYTGKVKFIYSTTDIFFEKFRQSDLSFVWFSPDYLDIQNIFSIFDCKTTCYFDWKDSELQKKIDHAYAISDSGDKAIKAIEAVENHLAKEGYVAPLAELNWWIINSEKKHSFPIHPVGLTHMSFDEFSNIE